MIEVGAQRYIEIGNMGLGPTRLVLVAFESLQTIYSGWNFAITVWVTDDSLFTAEAAGGGTVYLRPLESPPMWVAEGDLEIGSKVPRSPMTKDERPIAQFDLRVKSLMSIGIGSSESIIAGVDEAMRLILLRPKQDLGKTFVTQLTLGPGSCKAKRGQLGDRPVLAILESAREVLLVDPHEGHLIERISHRDMETLSDALHQTATSLVQTRDGIFILIANQMSEVLFWDVDNHRFAHKHVFDQLHDG